MNLGEEKEMGGKKSRLVARNCSYQGSCAITTKSPTIQHMTQGIFMTLEASITGMIAYTRDITKDYVQSRSQVERPAVIRAPAELNAPPGMVLRAVKPLMVY